jgi:hypothetical protein
LTESILGLLIQTMSAMVVINTTLKLHAIGSEEDDALLNLHAIDSEEDDNLVAWRWAARVKGLAPAVRTWHARCPR